MFIILISHEQSKSGRMNNMDSCIESISSYFRIECTLLSYYIDTLLLDNYSTIKILVTQHETNSDSFSCNHLHKCLFY